MSVYLVKGKGKGWRYDFTLKGTRHTEAWFKTKKAATKAEVEKRKELEKPKTEGQMPTDMGFLELLNRRLDNIDAYNSREYYNNNTYYGRRWVNEWKGLKCSGISPEMIESYLVIRAKTVSPHTANYELRCLKALFNFAMKPRRQWIRVNPTDGIEFFPIEKKVKYVPPKDDVLKVISEADADTQEYLWTLTLTMGRMSEINRLTWDDVDFEKKRVTLYTRKKKGGHLTPRNVPMPAKLEDILYKRFSNRDETKPWVFWHRYWSRKKGCWVEGPYKDRKRIMGTLCAAAEVRYFRFHGFRHFGASLLESSNTPIGSIQRILGHENRTTTEIYLHSMGDSEKNAMNILNQEMV